jgi:alkylated DNA repair dioxygenase AlkB
MTRRRPGSARPILSMSEDTGQVAVTKGTIPPRSFKAGPNRFRYDYTLRRLQEAEPIPEGLGSIVSQVEAFGGRSTQVRQILCTEYDTGVGIGWHRDKPHFDRVFGMSLGSACKFRFRRPLGDKWQRFTLDAEPRSLYMMSGAARHEWEHSIPAVEAPRYSITFRTMVEQNT